MVAEILAVGTELLLGDIVNTNAQFLSRELAKLGIKVYSHTTVGDNLTRMQAALQHAFEKADLVISTGGLGPTQDDITKDAAAAFFNKPLFFHEESWEAIVNRFKARGLNVTENNRRQAFLPEGCTVLPNENGSAPGVCLSQDGKTLILLPGPPNEMEPMFLRHVVPFLRPKTDEVFVSRVIKTVGVGESALETMLQDIIETQSNPTIALYAKMSEVAIRLTASASNEEDAHCLIEPFASRLYERLGSRIYGENDETLVSSVVRLLKERSLTLACAESCTGGLLTAALVDVPGVSDVLKESVIAYGNEAKIYRLGVDESVLKTCGAVSAQNAAAMAEGAAKVSGACIGISTTGIAGPGGGTKDKPAGLVYIGLSIKGKETQTAELRLSGSRNEIRRRAVVHALDFLRQKIN